MGQTTKPLGRNRTRLACRLMISVLLALVVFVSMPGILHAQTTDTLIYQFQGGNGPVADGTYPNASLVADSLGNLYGTTSAGGNFSNGACLTASTPLTGCGTIFELSPPAYAETVLYRFQGCPAANCGAGADGATPDGALIFDSYGNLYGTTANGGFQGCSSALLGCGTVFVLCLAPSSPAATTACNGVLPPNNEIVLGRMSTTLGRHPLSSLVMDAFGNLYGTNISGNNACGNSGCGGIFVVCAPGAGAADPAPCVAGAAGYAYNDIYGFNGTPDGDYPRGGLAIDTAGNLYGTTTSGGINNASAEPCGKTEDGPLILGCGIAFELSPSGGPTWKETVLYNFLGYPKDGSYPSSTVIFDAAGNLYGTTEMGPLGGGTVFELTPGTPWTERVLYKFANRWDGGNIYAGITFLNSADKLLAGTTYSGGGGNLGALYALKETTPGVWTEVGGTQPFAANGQQAVYGFENGHNFAGQCPIGTDGCNPYGGVLYLSATVNTLPGKYFFGTTYNGGNQSFGTVYAVLP